jgi:hypothetical protein
MSWLLGRSPSGRAIRYNGLFVTSQTISAAIPNAFTGTFHEICSIKLTLHTKSLLKYIF